MINKSFDLLYDGVNPQKIASAKPVLDQRVLALLKEFVRDRYEIHLKKDPETPGARSEF